MNPIFFYEMQDKNLKTSATSSVFVVPRATKLKKKSKKTQPKSIIGKKYECSKNNYMKLIYSFIPEPEMLEAVDKVSELFPETKEDTRNVLINKLEAVKTETELEKSAVAVQELVNEVEQVSDSSSTQNVETSEAKEVNMESKVKTPVKSQGPSVAEINSLLSQFKIDPDLIRDKQSSSRSDSLNLKRGSLFDGTRLQIFENVQFEESETTGQMKTWKKLYQRELQLSIASPPANGFQQMIQWTRQGKLWQFPINNEQGNVALSYAWSFEHHLIFKHCIGLEQEAQVGFHKHIFLEPYLNPWCPKRGPIRHFMELVCIGLSKNPYLTVSQKKEHINWFRNYFSGKRSILVETGAITESASNKLTV